MELIENLTNSNRTTSSFPEWKNFQFFGGEGGRRFCIYTIRGLGEVGFNSLAINGKTVIGLHSLKDVNVHFYVHLLTCVQKHIRVTAMES